MDDIAMDDIAYEDMEYIEFAEHYANGNLIDARQLYTSNPEDLKYSNNISIHSDQYIIFKFSCWFGYLNVAKWIHSFDNFNYNDNYNILFIICCSQGHLDVVQWLYSFGNIDAHIINKAFLQSCKNGYLDVAIWLYSLGNIDINTTNKAFRWGCKKGNLDIVQWLYSFGNIDIHYSNDYAFRISCKEGMKQNGYCDIFHLDIAKWLATLDDNYQLVIEDDELVSFKILNPLLDALFKNRQFDKIAEKINITKIDIDIDTVDCSICYEKKDIIVRTICKHDFCMECVYIWKYVNNHNKCPYCRQSFKFLFYYQNKK